MCDHQSCLSQEVVAKGLIRGRPHLPKHRVFKTRKFLPTRNIGYAWKQAKEAIPKGDGALAKALESYAIADGPSSPSSTIVAGGKNSVTPNIVNGKDGITIGYLDTHDESIDPQSTGTSSLNGAVVGPGCLRCSKRLQSPCWYCIDCDNGTFRSIILVGPAFL